MQIPTLAPIVCGDMPPDARTAVLHGLSLYIGCVFSFAMLSCPKFFVLQTNLQPEGKNSVESLDERYVSLLVPKVVVALTLWTGIIPIMVVVCKLLFHRAFCFSYEMPKGSPEPKTNRSATPVTPTVGRARADSGISQFSGFTLSDLGLVGKFGVSSAETPRSDASRGSRSRRSFRNGSPSNTSRTSLVKRTLRMTKDQLDRVRTSLVFARTENTTKDILIKNYSEEVAQLRIQISQQKTRIDGLGKKLLAAEECVKKQKDIAERESAALKQLRKKHSSSPQQHQAREAEVDNKVQDLLDNELSKAAQTQAQKNLAQEKRHAAALEKSRLLEIQLRAQIKELKATIAQCKKGAEEMSKTLIQEHQEKLARISQKAEGLMGACKKLQSENIQFKKYFSSLAKNPTVRPILEELVAESQSTGKNVEEAASEAKESKISGEAALDNDPTELNRQERESGSSVPGDPPDARRAAGDSSPLGTVAENDGEENIRTSTQRLESSDEEGKRDPSSASLGLGFEGSEDENREGEGREDSKDSSGEDSSNASVADRTLVGRIGLD